MWDSVVKNIGVLTAVATLVGSAVAFFVQRADDIQQRVLQAEAAERDSKRLFLDKQAEIYFETVPLVARLANAETLRDIDERDERRFWQIFWGELGMVEDADVARAMDLFGQSLNAFSGRTSVPSCAARRRSISLTLAHCVRKSLGENWGVDFRAEDLDWCTPERFSELVDECPTSDQDKAPPLEGRSPQSDTSPRRTRAN